MIDDRLVGYVNGWVAGWLGWLSYWHVWFCSVDLLAILIVWSLVCLSVYVFVLFDFCYFFVRSVFGCCLVCVFRLLLIRLLACSLDRPLLVVLLLLLLRLPPPSPPPQTKTHAHKTTIPSIRSLVVCSSGSGLLRLPPHLGGKSPAGGGRRHRRSSGVDSRSLNILQLRGTR